MAPSTGIGSGFSYTIPAQSMFSPDPSIPKVLVSHEADFNFTSDSEKKEQKSMTDIQFALGSATQGIPLTDKASFAFQSALSGGEGTAAYFQKQYTATEFIKWLNAQGSKAWTKSEDVQGHPVFQSTYPPSLHTLHPLSMVLATVPNQEVISGK